MGNKNIRKPRATRIVPALKCIHDLLSLPTKPQKCVRDERLNCCQTEEEKTGKEKTGGLIYFTFLKWFLYSLALRYIKKSPPSPVLMLIYPLFATLS